MRLISPKDRKHKARIGSLLEQLGFWVEFMPEDCQHNYLLYNRTGNCLAVAATKYRTTPRLRYPTLEIDKEKIDHLLEVAEVSGVRPLLIVEWAGDGVWTWRCHYGCQQSSFVRHKKRSYATAVVDAADPSYLIPVTEFKKVSN